VVFHFTFTVQSLEDFQLACLANCLSIYHCLQPRQNLPSHTHISKIATIKTSLIHYLHSALPQLPGMKLLLGLLLGLATNLTVVANSIPSSNSAQHYDLEFSDSSTNGPRMLALVNDSH
jgi:hypothetical protein